LLKGEGHFIILSGPSGVGKTLFLNKTLKSYPQFENTITYTTRTPRQNEKNGEYYYFISDQEFQKRLKEGQFAESAKVHSYWYGTAYEEIYRVWNRNKSIIKDLDIQGAKSIKSIYPKAITVFLYPPDMEILTQRLRQRGIKDINNLKQRLGVAAQEIAEGQSYDFKIVNDNFEPAWQEFKKIIEKSIIL